MSVMVVQFVWVSVVIIEKFMCFVLIIMAWWLG